MKSSAARFTLQLALVMATAAVASVAVEFLFRPPEFPVALWLTKFPRAVSFNAVLASLFGVTVLAVVGRAITATLVSLSLLVVLALAHASTLQTLGRPLFPWDLLLYREAWDVFPFVTARYGLVTLLVGAVVLAGGLVASLRFGPKAIDWRARFALLLPALGVALWLYPRPGESLKPLGIQHQHWVQAENYRENGLLLTFTMNLPAANVQRPTSYTRDAVKAAAAQRTKRSTTTDQPDVIVLMSESFFDPTRLPGVRFAEDPVPTVHRLQREAASGTLYPPVFGGGTANTEFEFLTGHSMRFLPPGSVPYQQYLRRKHASLAHIFAAQGYRTGAVHIYHRWFWEREQVYGHLGFQRFISMEGLDLEQRKTFYPADSYLTREIIKEVERAPEPLFLFAISVEAHGPYEPNRYPDATVRIDGPLDDAARAELTTYVEAVNHADRELGELVKYLERRGRPTVLVFFGDHLPSLPLALRQTGVLESIDRINQLETSRRAFLYEVPLLIWSNVKPGSRELGSMSSTFLGPAILEETGTPGTPYMDFLDTVRRRLPVVSPGLVSDSDGVFHDEMPEMLRGLEADWWTLEYDALFGDDYFAQEQQEG